VSATPRPAIPSTASKGRWPTATKVACLAGRCPGAQAAGGAADGLRSRACAIGPPWLPCSITACSGGDVRHAGPGHAEPSRRRCIFG
jgi:hypothetical protein